MGIVQAPKPLAGPDAGPVAVEIVVPCNNEERLVESSIRKLRAYLDGLFPFSDLGTIADNASTDAVTLHPPWPSSKSWWPPEGPLRPGQLGVGRLDLAWFDIERWPPNGFPGRPPGSFRLPPGVESNGNGPRAGGPPSGFPGGTGRAFGGPGGRSSDANAIDQWVEVHGTKVSVGSSAGASCSDGTLYFVSSAAAT